MPVIEAQRRTPCTVCRLPVEVGELVEHELQAGTRHRACADIEAGKRFNRYRTECHLCGAPLGKGQGYLSVSEREVSGAWVKTWTASCVDAQACDGRIRGAGSA